MKRNGKPNYKRRPNRNRKNWQKRDEKTQNVTEFKDGAFGAEKNDWRWYATDPQLVKDSASYPYGYPVGSRLNFGSYATEANKRSVPGICSILFGPTVGWSDNANAPINVIARSIFSDVRHTNSGYSNYEAPDLMIYLMSMDSNYMYLEHLKRAYGLMRSVSPVNRYYAKALVEALGFDYDNLVLNLDDFRAFINTYAQRLKKLAVPNGMSIMAKHQWMVRGLYQDGPTDKSQLYAFVPFYFFAFDYDEDNAGMLYTERWYDQNDLHGITFIRSLANKLLDKVLQDQDFAIMSGDILKWRTESGIIAPLGITETYQVFPTYDESVLDQIQNLSLVGWPWMSQNSGNNYPVVTGVTTARSEVRQSSDKKYLTFTPYYCNDNVWSADEINPGRNCMLSKRLINFPHDNVTPEETLEASRMTNIANSVIQSPNGLDWFKYTTIGSEVAMQMFIHLFALDSNGVWSHRVEKVGSMSSSVPFQIHSQGMTGAQLQSMVDAFTTKLHIIQDLSNFHRHPYLALTSGFADADSVLDPKYVPFFGYYGDINYYSIVDIQDLEQMSEIALLSEFSVRMNTNYVQ